MAVNEPVRIGPAQATRERLLDTAEQLFAEHGLEAVSLARITQEAGQRNASALHYHFGSKPALIEAILARRMEGINRRRLDLLDELEAGAGAGRAAALAGIARAMVVPFAEQIEDPEGGGKAYVRLIAQIHGDPRVSISELVGGKYDSGVRRAGRMLHEIMGEMPLVVVRERLALATTLVVHGIAQRVTLAANGQLARRGLGSTALFVANMVDVIVAMLGAPVSPATAAAVAVGRER